MPIAASDACAALKQRGFNFYAAVPCSYFKHAIDCIRRDGECRYLSAANEGAALAAAAGAAAAGARPVVLLQNSGFGNLVNPLTSLSLIYEIPALLFISARACSPDDADEPQHRIMGATLSRQLDTLSVRIGWCQRICRRTRTR
jgi:phosphonopyruvate decarboxylase